VGWVISPLSESPLITMENCDGLLTGSSEGMGKRILFPSITTSLSGSAWPVRSWSRPPAGGPARISIHIG
jgi:hypothetical protein